MLTPQETDPQGQSVSGAAEVENQPTAVVAEAPVSAPTEIPTKFVGKSVEELIPAYDNLEKELGRLRNEVGEKNKRLQEWEARQNFVQPIVQQPVASQPVKTLEDQYLEEFDVNPKAAILKLNKAEKEQMRQELTAAQQQEFYNQAKSGSVKGYDNFAELEPEMINLTGQFVDLIRPDRLTDPKLVKALYLMARGSTSTDQIAKAEKKGAQRAEAIRKEKAASASESPGSSLTKDTVNFEGLTREEQRKFLGVADRSVVE